MSAAGAAVTSTQSGWFKPQLFTVPPFWRPQPEIRVSAGVVSPEDGEEQCAPGLSLVPGGSQAAFGLPSPVGLSSLPSLSHFRFCLQMFPLLRTPVTLARWLSCWEHHPFTENVVGSIPGSGHIPGLQPIDVSFSLSLPLFL